MAEDAPKKRLRRAKKRVYKNLCYSHKYVVPFPEPIHYFCSETNTYIRVEIDELKKEIKEDLRIFKNHHTSNAKIHVYLFKKGIHKPELIKINGN